ncbi:MAG TPA: hypothetical protein VLS45_01985 [Methylomicrobium sp.]|nr:hypothetical protein [Methylomicrobium sp.]
MQGQPSQNREQAPIDLGRQYLFANPVVAAIVASGEQAEDTTVHKLHGGISAACPLLKGRSRRDNEAVRATFFGMKWIAEKIKVRPQLI